MTFIVWITGLPCSGKSTIAKKLVKELSKRKANCVYLNLDNIRNEIVANPTYTESERDYAYNNYADKAYELADKGINVVMDATAHKKKYRDYLRQKIKNGFIEIYIKCPLKICIQREQKRKTSKVMKDLYKKAIDRKKTGKKYSCLGEVPGVDVWYEENKKAELIINSDKIKAEQAVKIIMNRIDNK